MPSKNRKKKLVAILAGIAVAAAVSASASTLGGTATDAMGADLAATKSAVTKGVVVAWDTAYSATAKEYVVTGVTLKTKDATEKFPTGSEVKLTVTGNSDGDASKPLAALSTPLTKTGANTTEVSWTGLDIPAADVLGVAVVVDGNAVAAAN
jgi:hypothetical protein